MSPSPISNKELIFDKLNRFRCFESQCKPTYGACDNSCDCVDKYNMRKGEGKCYNKQCLCR